MKYVEPFTQTFYRCTDPRAQDPECGHYTDPDQIYWYLALSLVGDDPKYYDKYPNETIGTAERDEREGRVVERLERWLKWKDSVTTCDQRRARSLWSNSLYGLLPGNLRIHDRRRHADRTTGI